MARPSPRIAVLTTCVLFVLAFIFLFQRQPLLPEPRERLGGLQDPREPTTVSPDTQKGEVIMSKLGNETLKAELGRAAWKVIHTTMARFPDQPSDNEKEALRSYIWLFARLYPCGECAQHFQVILKKFPPQVATRSMAAAWACHVHNEVNKSLRKDLFDCSKIGDFYDCGCGDEEEADKVSSTEEGLDLDVGRKVGVAQDARDTGTGLFKPVQIAKEPLMNGG